MYASGTIKVLEHILLIAKSKCCMFNVLLHYTWTVYFIAEVHVTLFTVFGLHNNASVKLKIMF